MQRALQSHHFRGKVISLQGRPDLIGNAFNQRDFMIFETITGFTPNQTEQSERVTGDAHRRDQGRSSSECCIEHDPQRQGQIVFQQLQGLALCQHFNHSRVCRDIHRLTMGFDQAAYVIGAGVRRSFEGGETYALFVRIEHAQGAIIRPHQRQRAVEHRRSYLAKIRSRIEGVGDFQQCFCRFSLALLVGVDSRVLITNRQLHGN